MTLGSDAIPILVAALAFLSFVMISIGLATYQRVALRERLGLASYSEQPGAAANGSALSLLFRKRALPPEGRGGWVSYLLPRSILISLRKMLAMAGDPISLNAFIALSILCGLLLLVIVIMIAASGGKQTLAPGLLFAVSLGIAGFALPFVWVRGRMRRRQQVILKSLPDAFDLITTSVEAGLGLDAAFYRLVEKTKGPFADELAHALRDTALGRLRREALTEMGGRAGVRELSGFVNAVIQAEQLGVGIAQVLRVQSEQMRTRRRQLAEEAAHRAPILMVFPLVLCIFPALMIVILGPGIIRLIEVMNR